MKTEVRSQLRRRANLTLFALGQRVGKSAGTLSLWERGHLELSPTDVELIARAIENELTKQPAVSSAAQIVGMLAGASA
jgi:transcriptional regulator with XRE-family HTH domain